MPIAYLDTVDSPAGPLAFAVNDAGALVRTQFVHGSYARSIEQELERAGYQVGHAEEGRAALWREQLLEYAHGVRQAFDLPLALGGTEWQRRVWLALTTIPFGQTLSYGELAARLGRPHAARAVGHANGANPLSLVVPCHRLIGANGSLTGYGGGLDIKERLLAHEARVRRELSTASVAP
jgi:methylated-DNA-[protein]-cysteine S-methyltransferase